MTQRNIFNTGGADLKQIVVPLLAWYRANQRILPWRENTDAYRVWGSESVLQ